MPNKVIAGGKANAKFSNRFYIGRSSIFGNPYVIGEHGTREEVIAKYAEMFYNSQWLQSEARRLLLGKTLVCHCKPLACHGDVLVQYLLQFDQIQETLV